MKTLFNKKSLFLAAAISAFSSAAMAGYTIVDLGENVLRDIENGVVVKSEYTNPNTRIVVIDDNVETVIVDSLSAKSDLNISSGIVYWSEFENGIRVLYAYEGGQISVIAGSANEKEGFSYDDLGNIAWVEFVDGGNELFFYDSASQTTTQITTGHTGYELSGYYKAIQVSNGNVVWKEGLTLNLWDGQTTTQIATGTNAWPSIDGDKAIWTALDSNSTSQVFQYENGVTSQLTNDAIAGKAFAIIEDGTVTYEVSTHYLGVMPDNLYAVINGQSVLLSESATNPAHVDGGKIVWTEGPAEDAPFRLFEYINGVTTEIDAGPNRKVGLEAEAGYIMWNDIGSTGTTIKLAKPDIADAVNLGAEHSYTSISVNGELDVEVSQWSGWSWTPTYVEFAFAPLDGQSLEGVTIVGQDGTEYALSGSWERIPQTFDWNAQSVTVKASGRDIEVQWWATTEPNGVNIGAEHGKTVLDLTKATTVEISQWSNWGWNPVNVGVGFGSVDGSMLDGIVVIDSDGNTHALTSDWSVVVRPFYWQPIKLVIPAQPGRTLDVEWWAQGY